MAKQRTREQKQRALIKRQQQTQIVEPAPATSSVVTSKSFTFSSSVSTDKPVNSQGSFSGALARTLNQRQSSTSTTVKPNLDLQQFFGFDPKLIYRDLAKTIAISLVLLAILVVFSWLAF